MIMANLAALFFLMPFIVMAVFTQVAVGWL
jgi:TRAP-type mannitol/chloroaromatic compound transport system permease small subunit